MPYDYHIQCIKLDKLHVNSDHGFTIILQIYRLLLQFIYVTIIKITNIKQFKQINIYWKIHRIQDKVDYNNKGIFFKKKKKGYEHAKHFVTHSHPFATSDTDLECFC